MTTGPLNFDTPEAVEPLLPPIARKQPRTDLVHGQRRVDDYFWLRDKDDPEVRAYLEEENRYAEAVMAPTRLNLAGIGRVEFLPGAQSAIWGNQALAGVLQLSTEPAGRVRRLALESGSFDSRYGSVQLADHGGDWYYNVSGSDFSTDGTNVARQGSERDGYDNNAWFAAGGFDRDRWSLRGLVRRTWTTSEYDPTPWPTYLPVDGDALNTHDETHGAARARRPWRRTTVAGAPDALDLRYRQHHR